MNNVSIYSIKTWCATEISVLNVYVIVGAIPVISQHKSCTICIGVHAGKSIFTHFYALETLGSLAPIGAYSIKITGAKTLHQRLKLRLDWSFTSPMDMFFPLFARGVWSILSRSKKSHLFVQPLTFYFLLNHSAINFTNILDWNFSCT